MANSYILTKTSTATNALSLKKHNVIKDDLINQCDRLSLMAVAESTLFLLLLLIVEDWFIKRECLSEQHGYRDK